MQIYIRALCDGEATERQKTAARQEYAKDGKFTNLEFRNYCAALQEARNNEIATTKYIFQEENGWIIGWVTDLRREGHQLDDHYLDGTELEMRRTWPRRW